MTVCIHRTEVLSTNLLNSLLSMAKFAYAHEISLIFWRVAWQLHTLIDIFCLIKYYLCNYKLRLGV